MRGKLKNYKIAVIEGDGIGREVVPEGIRVLEAAARRFDLSFTWQHFDWSCETYVKTGRMMPEDGLEQLRPFDAIYLGAVGYPGVPDHISLWGLLIPIRRDFRQYVNLRPVRLFEGVEPAIKTAARQAASALSIHLLAWLRLVPASGSCRNSGDSDRSMSSENRCCR